MPAVFASLFVCERVFQEKDDVISVLRIVDTFYVTPLESLPKIPNLPPPAIPMFAVGIFKIISPDDLEHSFQFRLTRPSGENVLVDKALRATPALGAGGAPGGVNIIVPINLLIKELGVHQLEALCDGVPVATTFFTLVVLKPN